MEINSRTRLDFEALAEAGERLAGRLDAATLDRRLADALAMDRAMGEVRYALDFRSLTDGAVAVSGDLHAELVACCQRCLEPFELMLNLAPRVLIPGPDRVAPTEEGWELAEGDAPSSLAAFIEDELLLGLPFAPRHPEGDCSRKGSSAPASKTGTQRPFSGLAEALEARKTRDG
ncbi:MAG: YceD family protein [Gammaproteobacteria bacterium]